MTVAVGVPAAVASTGLPVRLACAIAWSTPSDEAPVGLVAADGTGAAAADGTGSAVAAPVMRTLATTPAATATRLLSGGWVVGIKGFSPVIVSGGRAAASGERPQ
ncbi:hypothetical protein ACWENR_08090 [Micromonospora sp. NPDC004336]